MTSTATETYISATRNIRDGRRDEDVEIEMDRLSGTLQGASFEQELLPITRRRQIFVLIVGFFAVFQTIGFNQAYGVFQSYYISDPNSIISKEAAKNTALVAFVGTLGAGLTWSGSIFVNPLMARTKDLRYLTVAGALLMSIGYGLASLATEVWHLLLTQGLTYGIGSSLLYFPILSTAPEYFSTHRGAAMGLILSAAGLGGLALSPITQALLTRVGPRWTLRILALLNLAIAGPVALGTSPSRSAQRRPTLVNVSIAKRPVFVLQACGALLQAAGNLVPLTFMPEFSRAMGETAGFGAVMLAVNNGVNSVSRVGMGVVADKAGRQNTLIVSVLGSAVSVGALWAVAAGETAGARGLWVAFVVVYGVTAGGYNALFPTTITEVFGIQAYASVNGFAYFVRGLGAFGGSPIGGEILSKREADPALRTAATFKAVVWYDAALLFAATACVMGVRGFDAYDKRKWAWKA